MWTEYGELAAVMTLLLLVSRSTRLVDIFHAKAPLLELPAGCGGAAGLRGDSGGLVRGASFFRRAPRVDDPALNQPEVWYLGTSTHSGITRSSPDRFKNGSFVRRPQRPRALSQIQLMRRAKGLTEGSASDRQHRGPSDDGTSYNPGGLAEPGVRPDRGHPNAFQGRSHHGAGRPARHGAPAAD